MDSVVRRVDKMHGSQITRGIYKRNCYVKNDLEINELDRNMVYDRTLCRHLINVEAWLLLLFDGC